MKPSANAIGVLAFAAFLVTVVLVAGHASVAAQIMAGLSIAIMVTHSFFALGRRDALIFVATVLLVTFTIENIGVATGFPFGDYYFVVGNGLPRVGHIPLIVGFLYLGMGYPAWIIAGLILGSPSDRPKDFVDLVARPLVGAFTMVQWDAVMDPSNATIGGLWVWREGGAYFGVPLSNYLGWFLTVWTMFAVFAMYCIGTPSPTPPPKPASFWLVPVLLYLAAALCLIPPLFTVTGAIVHDGSDRAWHVNDIRGSAVVVMLSTMLPTSVLALLRLWGLARAADRIP